MCTTHQIILANQIRPPASKFSYSKYMHSLSIVNRSYCFSCFPQDKLEPAILVVHDFNLQCILCYVLHYKNIYNKVLGIKCQNSFSKVCFSLFMVWETFKSQHSFMANSIATSSQDSKQSTKINHITSIVSNVTQLLSVKLNDSNYIGWVAQFQPILRSSPWSDWWNKLLSSQTYY